MKCKIDECDCLAHVAKYGLCKTHYNRQMKLGHTNISREAPDLSRVCSVDGCNRPNKAKSLCGVHYQYMMRNGSATPDLKKSAVK